ncbi:MAG TPA: hypothetical protein VMN57_15505 [Anaerolineales bacterium]|nr:hypothetical protein [Anaerolineales bacterium]
MSTSLERTRRPGFKTGWWILMSLSVLSVVGHAGLLFALPDEEILFLGWVVFSLYSVAILIFPYRRGEKWAWFATWLIVLAFAVVILFDSEFGLMYLAMAGLMALGQTLTRGAFFSGGVTS